MKRILVLAPNTDDGELGCGGTIAKLLAEGCSVFYAAFSVCEDSVPAGMPKNILETEVKNATATLGVASENLLIYRYPVRRFDEHRQSILDDMVVMNRTIKPDLVIMPGRNDIHQDHQVIAAEGIRAFKRCSILCYEMVWNNISTNITAFIKLSQEHIDKKVGAMQCYSSQQKIREYMNRDFIESLAKVRGVQIDAQYAEGFEVVRWIL